MMKSMCFVLHPPILKMIPKQVTRSQPGTNTAPLHAGVRTKCVLEQRARVWGSWWTGSLPRLAAAGEASSAAAPSRACWKDQAENSSLERMPRRTKGPAKNEAP